MQKIIVTVAAALISFAASAHAVFIETNPTGKKGTSQEVKVYFGEYTTQSFDSVKGWYSDINTLTLWVEAEGEKPKQLTLTDAGLYYKADFTPAKNKIYTLKVAHTVAASYMNKQLVYYAVAYVNAGDNKNKYKPASTNVSVIPVVAKNEATKTIQVFIENKTIANQTVEVVSPTGKKQEITTNDKGIAAFTPEEKGNYFIEVIERNNTPGEHNGEKTKGALRIVTMLLKV